MTDINSTRGHHAPEGPDEHGQAGSWPAAVPRQLTQQHPALADAGRLAAAAVLTPPFPVRLRAAVVRARWPLAGGSR